MPTSSEAEEQALNWPLKLELPVLWGDMDAFGHVNNTIYFRWFESARIAYFLKLGEANLLSNKEVGPILAHTSADYIKPVAYPDTIMACAAINKVGNTSFTMSYKIISKQQNNDIVTRGAGIVVLVDYRTGQKSPISDSLRQKVLEFQESSK